MLLFLTGSKQREETSKLISDMPARPWPVLWGNSSWRLTATSHLSRKKKKNPDNVSLEIWTRKGFWAHTFNATPEGLAREIDEKQSKTYTIKKGRDKIIPACQ